MKDRKKILQEAKNTLLIESKAIEGLIDQLDDNFPKVVELIQHSKGRLIITGIGKSGVIAMKIVSTLNSTGTPAVFMHAADAIHGDLGIVQKDDIVMCLSKSGTSPEIKDLVPHIKNRGNILIGITANKQGDLANASDYVLLTAIEKEACPNNLAPTSSTTAQLAMGDALAVCLLKLKDFGATDFAKHHPGGALGKRLYLTVGQIASKNQCPKVKLNTPVEEVIDEITTKRLGTTVVMDHNNIVGIVTDGDIRRMLKNKTSITGLSAQDIMSPSPILIKENMLATKAMSLLEANAISHLVVVDQSGNYQGILHILDIIKEGISA
ncbi:MAG: KpsF/GutQ family sugar-phosphate isomerase [Flavobacteriaceae bacterium]